MASFLHWRQIPGDQISNGNRDQITLDGHRLFEFSVAWTALGGNSTHQSSHLDRISQLGLVGELHRGSVLAR